MKIKLELESDKFPILSTWPEERLIEVLKTMVERLNLPVTKASLESQASNLEIDLQQDQS